MIDVETGPRRSIVPRPPPTRRSWKKTSALTFAAGNAARRPDWKKAGFKRGATGALGKPGLRAREKRSKRLLRPSRPSGPSRVTADTAPQLELPLEELHDPQPHVRPASESRSDLLLGASLWKERRTPSRGRPRAWPSSDQAEWPEPRRTRAVGSGGWAGRRRSVNRDRRPRIRRPSSSAELAGGTYSVPGR